MVIDFQVEELEIGALRPEGLCLCLAAPEDIQPGILRRLEKWRRPGREKEKDKNETLRFLCFFIGSAPGPGGR